MCSFSLLRISRSVATRNSNSLLPFDIRAPNYIMHIGVTSKDKKNRTSWFYSTSRIIASGDIRFLLIMKKVGVTHYELSLDAYRQLRYRLLLSL